MTYFVPSETRNLNSTNKSSLDVQRLVQLSNQMQTLQNDNNMSDCFFCLPPVNAISLFICQSISQSTLCQYHNNQLLHLMAIFQLNLDWLVLPWLLHPLVQEKNIYDKMAHILYRLDALLGSQHTACKHFWLTRWLCMVTSNGVTNKTK